MGWFKRSTPPSRVSACAVLDGLRPMSYAEANFQEYRYLEYWHRELRRIARRYDESLGFLRAEASAEEFAALAAQDPMIVEAFALAVSTWVQAADAHAKADDLERLARMSDDPGAPAARAQREEADRLAAVVRQAVAALDETAQVRSDRAGELMSARAQRERAEELASAVVDVPSEDSLRAQAFSELLSRQAAEARALSVRLSPPNTVPGRDRGR